MMPVCSFGGMETPTTLDNSYCVPKTAEEWRKVMPAAIGKVSFGAVWFAHGSLHNINQKQLEYGGRTEITVPKFLDLFHDRITGWRLEEVGFSEWINLSSIYELDINESCGRLRVYSDRDQLSVSMDVGNDGVCFYPTTFTDLLTLIKFLTPPVK